MTPASRRLRGLGALLATAFAMVVAACAIPTPTPVGTPSAVVASPPVSSSGAPAEPTSGPPVFSGPVTCGDDHAFAADLLFVEGRAEADPDPGAGALRAFLTSPDGTGMPRSGWVRTSDGRDRVQFVVRGPTGDEWLVAGFFQANGEWQVDLAGQCSPRPVAPAGTSLAAFWLDPAFDRPVTGDTVIHGLIVERACASGKPPVGRVLEPQVFEGDTWVVVQVTVANVPGGADCPGNPTFPLTVTLPSPLGDRGLFDGSVVPPRDAMIPAP